MALSRKQKRWMIILGSILVVLIILIIFANSLISRKADSILRDQLSKLDSTQYVIDYDRIRVNIFRRPVRLDGIRISPSDAIFSSVPGKGIRLKNATPLIG